MDFIRRHLSQIMSPTVPVEKQAHKLLSFMGAEQLEMFIQHHTVVSLNEQQIDEQLKKLGFLSKINLFEKKAILSDLIKKRLVKIILNNHNLIDYNKLSNGADSELAKSLRMHFLRWERESETMEKKRKVKKIPYVPVFEARFPNTRPRLLHFCDKNGLLKNLSEDVLPLKIMKSDEKISIRKKRRSHAPISFYKDETKQEKIDLPTELATDPNLVLRKKKALYYEPSQPIDYKNDKKLELNDIFFELNQIEEPKIDPDIYDDFLVKEFIDQILFVNNGLEIPKESMYSSLEEFGKVLTSEYRFASIFLGEYITKLLLNQDKHLSVTDASFLAQNIRYFLSLPELEYFYNIYLKMPKDKPDRTRGYGDLNKIVL